MTEVNTVTNDELREKVEQLVRGSIIVSTSTDNFHIVRAIEYLTNQFMQLITADREKLLERVLELKPLTTADSAVNVWEERITELQTKRKALDNE